MNPPSLKLWQTADPYLKGFWSYTYSAWEKSEIPPEKMCPYEKGTSEYTEFWNGVQAAVIEAQDSEE